jgi:hypothetical protein
VGVELAHLVVLRWSIGVGTLGVGPCPATIMSYSRLRETLSAPSSGIDPHRARHVGCKYSIGHLNCSSAKGKGEVAPTVGYRSSVVTPRAWTARRGFAFATEGSNGNYNAHRYPCSHAEDAHDLVGAENSNWIADLEF